MRSAVWSLSLREWQCEECEEAFWANQIEASERRRALAAPHRAGSEDAPVRGHRPGPYRAHSLLATDRGEEPRRPWLTVENVLTALWLAYFVGLAVMWW
jgi:hypothetical protein